MNFELTFQIYKLLKENEILSGEKAAEILKISRSAVLKHIEKLRKANISVSGINKSGYKIQSENSFNEFSLRYELLKRGLPLNLCFKETESTNNLAKSMVQSENFRGLIAAPKQKLGRGRLERTFFSDEGGIYFTLVIKPDIHPINAPRYVIMSCLAVHDALSKIGIKTGLKWPNDVYFGDKKLCGILIENFSDFDKITSLMLGIGLNVNNNVSGIDKAISVKNILQKEANCNAICAEIIKSFFDIEKVYLEQGFDPIKKKYLLNSITIGKKVKISKEGGFIEGYAEGINDNGFLILNSENFDNKLIFSGDVI